MRVCALILAGLLATHVGTLRAATATAGLSVSATVSSICAISSGSAANQAIGAGRGLARVHCSPAASYVVSFDPRPRDMDAVRRVEMRVSALPSQPAGRDKVLVVEIAY